MKKDCAPLRCRRSKVAVLFFQELKAPQGGVDIEGCDDCLPAFVDISR